MRIMNNFRASTSYDPRHLCIHQCFVDITFNVFQYSRTINVCRTYTQHYSLFIISTREKKSICLPDHWLLETRTRTRMTEPLAHILVLLYIHERAIQIALSSIECYAVKSYTFCEYTLLYDGILGSET